MNLNTTPPVFDGYAEVSQWISQDPDNEPFIFRKFDELAAHNILCLQSELLEIEERLKTLNKTIYSTDDPDLWSAGREWESLMHQSENDQQGNFRQEVFEMARERISIIKELRAKIKEYHEALLLQSKIANLQRPDPRVLAPFQAFLRNEHPLGGKASGFLGNPNDLVALKVSPEQDVLSKFLRRRWGKATSHPTSTASTSTSIAIFPETTITRTVNCITILLAAVFLIGSIVGLHFVRRDSTKLCMISLFTTGFAGCVALITSARRAEIFAATAA